MRLDTLSLGLYRRLEKRYGRVEAPIEEFDEPTNGSAAYAGPLGDRHKEHSHLWVRNGTEVTGLGMNKMGKIAIYICLECRLGERRVIG